MRFSAFLVAATLAFLGVTAAAVGQTAAVGDRVPTVSVTEHTGTFNGQVVRYTAAVVETFIPGVDGKPAGSMVTTTYLRQDVKDRVSRPVLFAFNGGPGASSTPLHLNAFGPRRYVTQANGEREMGDNPFSPLDAIDLVFIDPIGTGFSRPLPGVDGQQFWSVPGDAASVKTFIQMWLKANGREASPRILCGESYGTTRAAEIVSMGKDLTFNGVMLLSMTGGSDDPDMKFVLLLPTFAATAAYHGKVDATGRTPGAIFDEALSFAYGDYLATLKKGQTLPAGEKTRVAEEVSKRIGLPAAFVLEKNLRIDRRDYMLNLLKDRGLRTGQIDARATGKLEEYAGKKPPYDDPSMFGPKGGPSKPVAHLYFTNELQFKTAEQYSALNLDVNSKWKFSGNERSMRDPAGVVGAVMRDQPTLHLFWAGGYYDITTPLSNGKYILDRAGVPPERLTVGAFPTGHSVFDGDDNLARFNEAVRQFAKRVSAGR
jgi:carboxypeptidase C (cathepsin A)